MDVTPEALHEAAMKLPENERLNLVTRLLDTVPPGITSNDDPDFIEELDRRFNDGTPTIPWSEIRDRD